MLERIVSLRALNRATLARQSLLARRRLPVPLAMEAVGPLQAQWPPSPYVALWSHIAGFPRADLARTLEDRRVGQPNAGVRAPGARARAAGALPPGRHRHQRRHRGTFLVDVVVAGTWAVARQGGAAVLRLVRFVEPDATAHGVA